MNTSVDTALLHDAASALRSESRAVDQQSREIEASSRSLDLEIKARERIDARMQAVADRFASHSRSLARHAEFLAHAADEYERTEAALVAAAVAVDVASRTAGSPARYLGEAHVGGVGITAVLSATTPPQEGVRPSSILDGFRQLVLDATGDRELADAYAHLVAATPVVGSMLSYDELITMFQNRDADAANETVWTVLLELVGSGATLGGIPGVGPLFEVWQAFLHFAASDWAAQHIQIPDNAFFRALDMQEELQWVTDRGEDVVTVVSNVKNGIESGADHAGDLVARTWDWLKP